MSFLKELQIEYNYNTLSLEYYNLNEDLFSDIVISTESFLDKAKDIIQKGFKKIWDFFTGLFKRIKDTVMKFFKSDKVKKITEVSEILNKLEAISEEDLNKEINKFFNGGKYNTGDLMAHLVFNNKGQLFDIDKIIKEIDNFHNNFIKRVMDSNGDMKGFIKSAFDFDPSYYGDFERMMQYASSAVAAANGTTEKINSKKDDQKLDIPKVSKETILGGARKLHDYINRTESYYNKKYGEMKNEISKLEKQLDETAKIKESDLTDEQKETIRRQKNLLNAYYAYLKLVVMPQGVVGLYIQLLNHLVKGLLSEEYTTTNEYKFKNLYHLSSSGTLKWLSRDLFKKPGTLRPDLAASGLGQMLPARVSFAETVIGCCYGTPRYWDYPGKTKAFQFGADKMYKNGSNPDEWPEEDEVELYLYEGVPDKDTHYIKEEFVQAIVGEAQYSKEICVTTQIKINKIGKVKIRYRPKLDLWDPHKFIDYTIVK